MNNKPQHKGKADNPSISNISRRRLEVWHFYRAKLPAEFAGVPWTIQRSIINQMYGFDGLSTFFHQQSKQMKSQPTNKHHFSSIHCYFLIFTPMKEPFTYKSCPAPAQQLTYTKSLIWRQKVWNINISGILICVHCVCLVCKSYAMIHISSCIFCMTYKIAHVRVWWMRDWNHAEEKIIIPTSPLPNCKLIHFLVMIGNIAMFAMSPAWRACLDHVVHKMHFHAGKMHPQPKNLLQVI